MEDDEDVIEVVVPVDEIEINSIAAGKTIWNEITAGVGVWGAMRPIFAVVISLVPFLFLGQHFNKKHGKGKDWFLLQIPLAFTELGTRRFFFETDFANTSNPVHIKGSSGTNLMTFNTSSSSARACC